MSFEDFVNRWWDWIIASSWQLAILIGLITLLTRCLQNVSPRLRYGLWLLVLLKVFLPPWLTAPWSLGQWAVLPVVSSFYDLSLNHPIPSTESSDEAPGDKADEPSAGVTTQALAPRAIAFAVWSVGVIGFFSVVGLQWFRLRRRLRSATFVDEGPLRVALEEAAMSLGLTTTPELVVVPGVRGPFLIGIVKPWIVLPDDLQYAAGSPGLESVLAHELIHWQRRDTWTGCVQVVVQGLLWFHPFVWWANGQTRHERECVCDDEVLRRTAVTPGEYGESIIQRLTASQGRSPALGGVVGVLEQSSNLQVRLEQIMSYEKSRRSFGIVSFAALCAGAMLMLPMAPHPPAAADEAQKDMLPYPVVVTTSPKNGDLEVDPKLKWVTVTFDRDMSTDMSWTGSDLPVDDSRKPGWKDKRTCQLPVKLGVGRGFRVGINSQNYRNFKSQSGEPTPPTAIYFATKGAASEVKQKVRVPKIVSMQPANGGKDVDPATTEIKVTFDIPMAEGMSWVGGGESFPMIPAGQGGKWSDDRRTCTLPVTLKPAHSYKLGINAPKFTNFQSEWQVPAEPVSYSFTTRK